MIYFDDYVATFNSFVVRINMDNSKEILNLLARSILGNKWVPC